MGGKLFVAQTGFESAVHPLKRFLAIAPGIGCNVMFNASNLIMVIFAFVAIGQLTREK